METSTLTLIFVCLVGTYVVMFSFARRANEWFYVRRLGRKWYYIPPGDMGWPLVGKMPLFVKSLVSKDPDSFASSFISRYGATGIYRTLMYGMPCIIVCAPETCRRVLADEQNFKKTYPLAGLGGSKSFQKIWSEEHKYYRRLTAAAINGSETLSMYIRHIEEVMIMSLEDWSNADHPVEFATEMKRPAFRVILPVICGSEADSLVERMMKLLNDIRKGLGVIRMNFPGSKFHRLEKVKEEFKMLLTEVMDARRSAAGNVAPTPGRCLMDILLAAKMEDGHPLSDRDILDLIHTYLFAGFETTATATMLMMLFIHENPDIFEKVKGEQVRILKRRDSMQKGLSFHEIKQMDYLSKVIDETLRFMGSHLFREAASDVTINGYLVPKGWTVLVWLRAVHMDPDNYVDPKQFNPSRWENHKGKGGSFIPFGAGSRFCPGSDLAKLEICIFLHHFILNYELERINPGCPINYVPGPMPADKFLVSFRRLKSV